MNKLLWIDNKSRDWNNLCSVVKVCVCYFFWFSNSNGSFRVAAAPFLKFQPFKSGNKHVYSGHTHGIIYISVHGFPEAAASRVDYHMSIIDDVCRVIEGQILSILLRPDAAAAGPLSGSPAALIRSLEPNLALRFLCTFSFGDHPWSLLLQSEPCGAAQGLWSRTRFSSSF